MSTRLPFEHLSLSEQTRARAMFFNARNSDGYLYELDCDGRVLCRARSPESNADVRLEEIDGWLNAYRSQLVAYDAGHVRQLQCERAEILRKVRA